MLEYIPETGDLVWKVKRPGFAKIGGIAGHTDDNHRGHAYRKITVLGKVYKAHRVVWTMHYGDIPDGMDIDHINGNCLDNRLQNLRAVSQKDNTQNIDKARSDSSTGIRGVFPIRSKVTGDITRYRVTVNAYGKRVHIGYFKDADGAEAAYREARSKLHPGYVR